MPDPMPILPGAPTDSCLVLCEFRVIGIPGGTVAHRVLIEHGVLKVAVLRPQGRVHDHDVQKAAFADTAVRHAVFYHGQHKMDGLARRPLVREKTAFAQGGFVHACIHLSPAYGYDDPPFRRKLPCGAAWLQQVPCHAPCDKANTKRPIWCSIPLIMDTATTPLPQESLHAWIRLVVSVLLMTIGGAGMYSVTVVLPQIQAEFAVSRSDASLPYTLTMLGFGLGGILMGRLADRYGVLVPIVAGTLGISAGFVWAGSASNLLQFNLAQGLLIGMLGSSATMAPLVADTSQWFTRRRGIALAICMSGNYLAGSVWPPILQHFIDSVGWRQTYIGLGLFCLASMLPLALVYRRRPPADAVPVAASRAGRPERPYVLEARQSDPARPLGLAPGALLALLSLAGVACCVAMAMPQVHIVAYCGDLGFGAARGAQMLSLMLGMGIVSRLVSGWIADHIGGLRTLLLGAILQGLALLMFLGSSGLVSLYVVSALFGLFQGGIVPAYALIVREYFAPHEAGARVGTVLMATLFGMALGGWLSGAIFDLSGSYRAAFINGIAWNVLNVSIIGFLLYRARRGLRGAALHGAV